MIARRALTELKSEGSAYREQGTWSYVAELKLRQGFTRVNRFY